MKGRVIHLVTLVKDYEGVVRLAEPFDDLIKAGAF